MELSLYQPESSILKKYMDDVYFFKKEEKKMAYRAYPSNTTSVSLMRDAIIQIEDRKIAVYKSKGSFCCVAANCLLQPMAMTYYFVPDEICLNFKPFGFSSFAPIEYDDKKSFLHFTGWDQLLQSLFDKVYAMNDFAERIKIIEAFLLEQYFPIKDEELLLRTITMLENAENDKVDDIADALGVHPKYLYRSFKKYVGCSPAHYRTVNRFRRAIHSYIGQERQGRLVDVCYDNDYTDQSYFIRQFHKLTGDNPKRFFEDISLLANNRIAWKFL